MTVASTTHNAAGRHAWILVRTFSETRRQTELMHQYPTVPETNNAYISYGYAKFRQLFQWG